MKLLRTLLIAVVLVPMSILAQENGTRPADHLEGAWKFTIAGGKSPAVNQLMVLSVEGKDVYAVDPASGDKNRLSHKGGSIVVPMANVKQGSGSAAPVFATLPMRHSGKEWRGTLIVNNETMSVVAVPLVRIWACSHLDPTHTAESTQRMQELSKEHKCEGWHEVNPD